MKKIYKRFIAYLIDILIISIISMSITYMPIFNKELSNYRKYIKEYNKEYTNYLSFNNDLNKYFKDKKITNEEYNKLANKHDTYKTYLNKYYKDEKLSKKNHKKITKEINKEWSKTYKRYNYKLNKYSLVSNISSFIVIIIYFLGTNILMNGMTIGKKIMKLRIVSNQDNKDVIPLNYLVRTIILYNPIYYLAISLGIFIFNINTYYNWTYIWSDIKNYLELLIVIMIIARRDSRGLHELLSSTKIISTDEEISNNNEKNKDVIIIKKDNNKKRKSNSSKKIIIDEE
ncbi:MAG: RDD family protein [Bacilli bacterium]|nr:RDD family protein [Bacilli bacterium]